MHIHEFIDFIQHEKRGSVHTVVAYKNDLFSFEEYVKKEFQSDLIEVNYQMIRSWMVALMDQQLTPKSVNRKLSSLKSFYKFLIRKEVIKINPTTRIISPKIPKRLPSFVEEQKMENLFQIVQFSNNFEGLRDRMMMDMFYSTGIRRSELINVKISDFNGETVRVLGKGNKQRIIPITTSLLALKREYLKVRQAIDTQNSEYFFLLKSGKKLYPEFVYDRVIFYLGQVTSMSKKSPHVLRHTFATHLLNNGAEINAIKELLGHSSLAATQVYTHNSIEKLKNIYINAHPLAG